MDNNIKDTREKILRAAISIFGTKGEVTTKEITDEAGVNVAAINYYFGNKSNLLKEVEEHYASLLYNMQNEIILNEGISCEDRLLQWVDSLMEFMLRYPALVTLITRLATEDREYSPALVKKFFFDEELEDKLTKIIGEITGIKEKQILNFKYLQIFSGVLGPILYEVISKAYDVHTGILDIGNIKERKKYITSLIHSIMNSFE